MNKITITALFFAFAFTSCTNEVEEPIKKYVQNLDGTQLDLGVKFISIEEMPDYTGSDLSKDILKQIEEKAAVVKKQSLEGMQESLTNYEIAKVEMTYATLSGVKENQLKLMEIYTENYSLDSSIVADIDNNKYDDINKEINTLLTKKEKFDNSPDSIIFAVRKVKYSIQNPALNTRQELLETFYLTPDLSEVKESERLEN